jgi:hypothetical protein
MAGKEVADSVQQIINQAISAAHSDAAGTALAAAAEFAGRLAGGARNAIMGAAQAGLRAATRAGAAAAQAVARAARVGGLGAANAVAKAVEVGGLRAANAVANAAEAVTNAGGTIEQIVQAAQTVANAASNAFRKIAGATAANAADAAVAASSVFAAVTTAAGIPIALQIGGMIANAAELGGVAAVTAVTDAFFKGGSDAALYVVTAARDVRGFGGSPTQAANAAKEVGKAIQDGGNNAGLEALGTARFAADAPGITDASHRVEQYLEGARIVANAAANPGGDAVAKAAYQAAKASFDRQESTSDVIGAAGDVTFAAAIGGTPAVQAVLAAAQAGGRLLADVALQDLAAASTTGAQPSTRVEAMARTIQTIVRFSSNPADLTINPGGAGNSLIQDVWNFSLPTLPGGYSAEAANEAAALVSELSQAPGSSLATAQEAFRCAASIFRTAGVDGLAAARNAGDVAIRLNGDATLVNDALRLMRNTAQDVFIRTHDPHQAAEALGYLTEVAGMSRRESLLGAVRSGANHYFTPSPPYSGPGSNNIVDYTADGPAMPSSRLTVYTADGAPAPFETEGPVINAYEKLYSDLRSGADKSTIQKDAQQLAAIAGAINDSKLQKVALLVGSGYYGDSALAFLDAADPHDNLPDGHKIVTDPLGDHTPLNEAYLKLEVDISNNADKATIKADAENVKNLAGSDHPGLADAANNISNSTDDGSYDHDDDHTGSLTALMNNPPNGPAASAPPSPQPSPLPPGSDEASDYQKLLSDIKSGADADTINNDALALAASATANGDDGLAEVALDIGGLAKGIAPQIAAQDGINSSNELQVLINAAPGTPGAQRPTLPT